jgi:multicomponent K+:H+ antiporter subunit F
VIQTCIDITLGIFALAMAMTLYRLLRGPGITDRILALDTLYVNTIAILLLVGMRQASSVYFEAAVVIAMLGFVGTVVLTKFVIRRDIIE